MENFAQKKIAGKFPAIYGDGNAERFALRLKPNGVYSVDKRTIPATYHPGVGVNDGQPIVSVHPLIDDGIGFLGGECSIDVEK